MRAIALDGLKPEPVAEPTREDLPERPRTISIYGSGLPNVYFYGPAWAWIEPSEIQEPNLENVTLGPITGTLSGT